MVLFLLPNLPSSMICHIFTICFYLLQVTKEAKCAVPNLLVHGTNSWLSLLLLVMCMAFAFTDYEFLKGWVYCTKSQPIRLILFVSESIICSTFIITTVFVVAECSGGSKIINSFWSAALVSLVHRNLLREHCSLVDWRILEGNAPLASKWSTTLRVEFWAQHPPHTQTQPMFSPSVD